MSASMAVVLTAGSSLHPNPPPTSQFNRRRNFSSLDFPFRVFSQRAKLTGGPHFFNRSFCRIRSFQHHDAECSEAARFTDSPERQGEVVDDILDIQENKTNGTRSVFLVTLAVLLGIAATITLLSIGLKQPNQGFSVGIFPSSTFTEPNVGFTFKAFGYRVVLPEYAPGWIYFWLLMAAGCGLMVSEEALNIWVGISLARMLSLDGTWSSFVGSFSRNAPYILSTVLWVYWGVCISDMVPFYLGKLFRKSGASDDVCSKLGIGKEKAVSLARIVRRYGNLIGFVERFSFGVRNPTAFLAGALDISPECFFAGVCCGGLFTLPLQLGIGLILRERPVFALATVATVVGVWTVFPYAVAALTALFFYIRRR